MYFGNRTTAHLLKKDMRSGIDQGVSRIDSINSGSFAFSGIRHRSKQNVEMKDNRRVA